MKLIHLAPLLLLACAPGGAEFAGGPPPGRRPPVFISPMGEAFRGAPADRSPLMSWFERADADHDERLSAAEFSRDAMAFFARLDGDGDGSLIPAEVAAYELATPELRVMPVGAGPPGGAGPSGGMAPPAGGRPPGGMRAPPPEFQGAARFGLLAIPHPVASADADLDRSITRAEFAAAARRRFGMLDQDGTGELTLTGLQGRRGGRRR